MTMLKQPGHKKKLRPTPRHVREGAQSLLGDGGGLLFKVGDPSEWMGPAVPFPGGGNPWEEGTPPDGPPAFSGASEVPFLLEIRSYFLDPFFWGPLNPPPPAGEGGYPRPLGCGPRPDHPLGLKTQSGGGDVFLRFFSYGTGRRGRRREFRTPLLSFWEVGGGGVVPRPSPLTSLPTPPLVTPTDTVMADASPPVPSPSVPTRRLAFRRFFPNHASGLESGFLFSSPKGEFFVAFATRKVSCEQTGKKSAEFLPTENFTCEWQ